MQSNGFEVKATVEVDRGDDVLKGGHDAFDGRDVFLFECERRGCGGGG